MKYCTKCGAKLPDEAVFCVKCGGRVAAKNLNEDVNGIEVKNIVKSELEEYQQLLDEGLITLQEFDAMKDKIAVKDSEVNNAKTEKRNQQEKINEIDEEKKKDAIYTEALKKLELKTSRMHSEAIKELESLEDWKNAAAVIEKSKVELAEIKKAEEEKHKEEQRIKQEKKKKLWKRLKIGGCICAGLILLFIIIDAISYATLPDLNNFEETQQKTIHNMDYKIPDSWEADEDVETETFQRYIKNEDGAALAVLEILYTGEVDLAGEAAYNTEHQMSEDIYDIMPSECEAVYYEVTTDTSVFEVTIYYVEGTVKGESEVLDYVVSSFDIDGYKNPRKSLGITAKYTGGTKAGTKIDSDCEDISVVETFDTGVAEGEIEQSWTIEKPVTLKAGETSSVVLHIGEKEKNLKVECTTLSKEQYKAKCENRNYKNQLRKASYGKYIKISGQVLQDCGYGYYRISSSGGYDDVYMVYTTNSDIVEDDWVTVYGVTDGIYSYETVLGATQKVPSIDAKYVER